MQIRLKAILLTSCFTIICSVGFTSRRPVTVNADIHAGDLKGIRHRNLPHNAAIAVSVESSGKNTAMVVGASNCYIFFTSALSKNY
jgi:hypothetical protein